MVLSWRCYHSNMAPLCRLYQQKLECARSATTWLGVGVAVFQALSNLAINGVILAVVGHGGLLLATDQISPGNLMAFLVATQTIQRSEVTWRWGEGSYAPLQVVGWVVHTVWAGGKGSECRRESV